MKEKVNAVFFWRTLLFGLCRKRRRAIGVQRSVRTSVLHWLAGGFHQRHRRAAIHFTPANHHRPQRASTNHRSSHTQVRRHQRVFGQRWQTVTSYSVNQTVNFIQSKRTKNDHLHRCKVRGIVMKYNLALVTINSVNNTFVINSPAKCCWLSI